MSNLPRGTSESDPRAPWNTVACRECGAELDYGECPDPDCQLFGLEQLEGEDDGPDEDYLYDCAREDGLL